MMRTYQYTYIGGTYICIYTFPSLDVMHTCHITCCNEPIAVHVLVDVVTFSVSIAHWNVTLIPLVAVLSHDHDCLLSVYQLPHKYINYVPLQNCLSVWFHQKAEVRCALTHLQVNHSTHSGSLIAIALAFKVNHLGHVRIMLVLEGPTWICLAMHTDLLVMTACTCPCTCLLTVHALCTIFLPSIPMLKDCL